MLNKPPNNGKRTKSVIVFEDYFAVFFERGKPLKPNQVKDVKTDAKSNQRGIGMGTSPNQKEVFSMCE